MDVSWCVVVGGILYIKKLGWSVVNVSFIGVVMLSVVNVRGELRLVFVSKLV